MNPHDELFWEQSDPAGLALFAVDDVPDRLLAGHGRRRLFPADALIDLRDEVGTIDPLGKTVASPDIWRADELQRFPGHDAVIGVRLRLR